ncbi:MAG: tyrosine-type recombinase/integrase [Vulcanimicrobiaceae bacterium]
MLTKSEVQQLLREAKHPTNRCTSRHYLTAHSTFYPAVAFALYTGARLGEIMAMRWQDIDFRQRIVTISRSLNSTKRAD